MEQREWPAIGPVVGVVGGSGGVGASSLAVVIARAAGRSILIDLDVDGGGIDVVLGIESAVGARWSGLRLAGGVLDPSVLVEGLPAWGECSVLAADVASLEPGAVEQVLDTAARAGPVVLDLPRRDCAERAVALVRCDLVVILARGDVHGLVSAHAVASGLSAARTCGLLVRRGEVPAREAASLVGVELVGVLPAQRLARRGLDLNRPPRSLARVVAGMLAGMDCPNPRAEVFA